MRRTIFFAICTALMLGFVWLLRLLFTGISEDFGDGLFVGVFLMAILFWLVSRTIGEGSDGR